MKDRRSQAMLEVFKIHGNSLEILDTAINHVQVMFVDFKCQEQSLASGVILKLLEFPQINNNTYTGHLENIHSIIFFIVMGQRQALGAHCSKSITGQRN